MSLLQLEEACEIVINHRGRTWKYGFYDILYEQMAQERITKSC